MVERKDRYFKVLESELKGIELTVEETRFVQWVARWDLWTVQQFANIIKKCRGIEN